GEQQIQRADVLVIGGEEPAIDETLLVRVVVVVVSCCGVVGHGLPRKVWLGQPAGVAAGAEMEAVASASSAGVAGAAGAAAAGAASAFSAASQASNSARGTAFTATGMKPWSLPQSSAHWPR